MASKPDLSRLRVLILDSYAPMVRLVESILRPMGIRSVTASKDVEDALTKVAGADLCIVEPMLGSDDGLRFIRTVRRPEARTALLPIFVLTSHTSCRVVIESVLAGANDVLRKPFSAKAIRDRVTDAVLRPRPFVEIEGRSIPVPRGMATEQAKSLGEAEMRRAMTETLEGPRKSVVLRPAATEACDRIFV